MNQVQQSYSQWGRTASVPYGALRGIGPLASGTDQPPAGLLRTNSAAPALTSPDTPWPTLKRGMHDDDADAVLADAFSDDDGAWHAADTSGDTEMPPPSAPTGPNTRPMRPLPRTGLRATASMPPMRHLSQSYSASEPFVDGAMDDDSSASPERYRHIDFAAYATQADNF